MVALRHCNRCNRFGYFYRRYADCKKPDDMGKIFGGVLAAPFGLAAIFLYVKIVKSKKTQSEKS